jgi:hypothetical protein
VDFFTLDDVLIALGVVAVGGAAFGVYRWSAAKRDDAEEKEVKTSTDR